MYHHFLNSAKELILNCIHTAVPTWQTPIIRILTPPSRPDSLPWLLLESRLTVNASLLTLFVKYGVPKTMMVKIYFRASQIIFLHNVMQRACKGEKEEEKKRKI